MQCENIIETMRVAVTKAADYAFKLWAIACVNQAQKQTLLHCWHELRTECTVRQPTETASGTLVLNIQRAVPNGVHQHTLVLVLWLAEEDLIQTAKQDCTYLTLGEDKCLMHEETNRAAHTDIWLVVWWRSTCGEGCSDKVEGLMPRNALHQVHLHTNSNPKP